MEENEIKKFIYCFVSLINQFSNEHGINISKRLVHISLNPQLCKSNSPLKLAELIIDSINEREEKSSDEHNINIAVCNSNQESALELSVWLFCQ